MRKFLAHLGAVAGASALALPLALAYPNRAQAAPASVLVLPEQLPLRAAPRESSPLLTPLARGEALELRGQQGEWAQVWDHARERGGWVRAIALLNLQEPLPALLAQLRLARQQIGQESLGLGLAATLIERADAEWLASAQGAELLDHLVALQERVAARANAGVASAPTQVAVAARYGQALRSFTAADGSIRLCPAEEPARLLRGLPSASAAQQARAALQLSRADCMAETPSAAVHAQRLAWLEGVHLAELPPPLRKALLLRRSGVHASLAFAARADAAQARSHAQAAWADWLRLPAAEFDEDDQVALRDTALRLAPMRWALQPSPALQRGKLVMKITTEGAQTCVRVGESAPAHCTHGWVHAASLQASPDGRALLLAVQPLDGWTELWRLDADGSRQVLPPSGEGTGLGVAELAGWDRGQALVAREAMVAGKPLRRFELLPDSELHGAPLRWAGDPGLLAAFQRGAQAWKGQSPLAR